MQNISPFNYNNPQPSRNVAVARIKISVLLVIRLMFTCWQLLFFHYSLACPVLAVCFVIACRMMNMFAYRSILFILRDGILYVLDKVYSIFMLLFFSSLTWLKFARCLFGKIISLAPWCHLSRDRTYVYILLLVPYPENARNKERRMKKIYLCDALIGETFRLSNLKL
jgi:hypothetical protein